MTPAFRLGLFRRVITSAWAPVVLTISLAAVFVGRSVFSVRGETYFTLADDAMVSMRYARNLADGHGLVWNVGDAPVEGYSNLAWTLWMAVLHLFRLPDSKVPLLVMICGAGLLVANVIAARRLVREIAPSSLLAISLAGFFVALDHSLAVWTLRGFEVGLCALTVTLGCSSTARLTKQWSARTLISLCGVAALSTLTRDDVAPLWLGMAAYLAVHRADQASGRPTDTQGNGAEGEPTEPGELGEGGLSVDESARRTALIGAGALLACVLVTLALHALYRLRTYGVPLPNTYYLKVGGASLWARWTHGARTLASALLFCLPVGLLSLFGAVKIPQFRRARETWLLTGLFMVACLYSVHVGGDSLEHEALVNRFVSVTLPVFWVVVALAISRLARAQGGLSWGRVAAVVAVFAAYWNMHASIPFNGASALRDVRIGAVVAAAWIAAWTTIRHGKWPPADWLVDEESGRPPWRATSRTASTQLRAPLRSTLRRADSVLPVAACAEPRSGEHDDWGARAGGATATSAVGGNPGEDTRSIPMDSPPGFAPLGALGASPLSGSWAVSWATLSRAVALVVLCQAPAWIWSLVAGPIWAEEGERIVRYGLALGEATTPEVKIAVTWAGAIPYYARRDAVDLFGKCDAVIARGPVHPGGLFAPGHNKWDLDHSIGALRPDVIAQLPADDPADLPKIEAWGYDRVGPEVFVQERAKGIDRQALIRAACVIPWIRDDIWSYLGDPKEDWQSRSKTACPPPSAPLR